MVLDIASFLTSTLQKQWKTNHLDKKSDICVVEASQVGRRFRSAVEKEFTKTFLNDAEFVAAITCVRASQAPEGEPKDEPRETPDAGSEETADTQVEKTPVETSDSTEDLNESMKIQDLTKSMLSVPKGVAKPKAKKCVSETENGDKKEDKDDTEKSDPKKAEKKYGKKEEPKSEKTPDPETSAPEKENVEEAETEATGDKLKLKVQEAIKTALQIKDVNQKIDLEELPNYQEGYDVYFVKLAFKTKKSDTTEEG
jgi:hypothetical protein